MTQIDNLDNAHVLLLAIIFATESDLSRLSVLAAERNDVLTRNVLYRLLLTFLPADVDNQSALATFLQQLLNDFRDVSSLDTVIDTSVVDHISERDRRKQTKKLRLQRLASQLDPESDELSGFLVQWIHQLEETSVLVSTVSELVGGFADGRPQLQRWKTSILEPLLRLQNDFYPGQADILTLHTVEHLQGEPGVRHLLQFAEKEGTDAEIGRDITEIVTPWVQGASSAKRRRINGSEDKNGLQTSWDSVNDWIFTTSCTNFELAEKSILLWDGPPEHDNTNISMEDTSEESFSLRYAHIILAVILNSPIVNSEKRTDLNELLEKAITVTMRGRTAKSDVHNLKDATKADLMRNRLAVRGNPITSPSDTSFDFISTCISTQKILATFSIALSVASIADVALFGSDERQRQETGRIIAQIPQVTASGIEWHQIRSSLLQLHGAENALQSNTGTFGFLGRVSQAYLETQILDAALVAKQYSAISDTYLKSPDPPLPRDQIRDHIVSAIYRSYDGASNGNRSRGAMKQAFELLQIFQPQFPREEVFVHIHNLIKATHSLSYYQLTLQHGVPFQPVNIRIHHDPLSLIEKVLEQNSRAYTKLDDLIDIGRNLVRSNVGRDRSPAEVGSSIDERTAEAEHRITYLAITSALADHDFDTAYSYITTRLTTTPSKATSSPFIDDASWRAAYAAGKYRPQSSTQSLQFKINSLSKRMDLLSLALTLAPTPDPLSEILATWRRSEEEMDNLKAQALEEERSVDKGSNKRPSSDLPGGFALEDSELDAAETRKMRERRAVAGFSPTYEEEAPVGLFDMARGAASAFRKSAFPLGGAAAQKEDFTIRNQNFAKSGMNTSDNEADASADGLQRTRRKRDVVSGLVTGGLVSGMSWVLGAQPTPSKGTQNQADE